MHSERYQRRRAVLTDHRLICMYLVSPSPPFPPKAASGFRCHAVYFLCYFIASYTCQRQS